MVWPFYFLPLKIGHQKWYSDGYCIGHFVTFVVVVGQVEELENEKRQLIARLKSQEKRVDHLERAKRKEEIPLLLEASKQDEEEDKVIWKAKEVDRIAQSIIDRELAVKTRDRLSRLVQLF